MQRKEPAARQSIAALRSLLFAALILPLTAIVMVGGCSRNERSEAGIEEFGKDIADSVAQGHINGALEKVRTEKARAGSDSDAYYRAMTREVILNYYAGMADALLAHADSIIAHYSTAKSEEANFLTGKAQSAKAGYYTRYVYNPDSNIHYYKKALCNMRKTGHPGNISDAYLNLAGAYKDDGALDKSADYYGRGIQIADSANLPVCYRIPLYMGLASTYTALSDFYQSHTWWEKASHFWPDMNVNDRFHYLNNRGNDLYLQKDYKGSIVYFRRLDSLLSQNPDLEWERHFCQANMTDLYLHTDRPEEARSLMDSTEYYFTNVQPNEYICEHIRTQRLWLAMEQNRYGDVERMLDQWHVGSETRPEQKAERLEFLKEYYARSGQWGKAYSALSRHKAYEDSLRNANLRLSASERQMRYERDSRLQAMSRDLEMHRSESQRNYIVVMASVVIILLLVIVVILMRKTTVRREERMMSRIIKLRMQSLRARITPHFIYNALNHEIAARMSGAPSNLDKLVRLLHRQQYMVDELWVPLDQDLSFVDDYVAVESEGIDSPILFRKYIDTDIDQAATRVPSMLMQILVENAFKHGFISLPKGETRILLIRIRREEGFMVIDVLNNAGKEGAVHTENSRHGLKIVYGTLEILNDKKKSHITFETGDWTDNPQQRGFRATLRIPEGFNIQNS